MPALTYSYQKAPRVQPGLTSPYDRRITFNSTYAFTTAPLPRELTQTYCGARTSSLGEWSACLITKPRDCGFDFRSFHNLKCELGLPREDNWVAT